MLNTPAVSIGLPVWNGEPYIETALRSLQEQTFNDLEVIVCDNASTDGTEDIVRSLARQDPRIRYHRNETNIGGTRNFNHTLEFARGRYFRWAASDDFVSRGALAGCIEVLESDPSVLLAFPETELVDANGKVFESYDDGDGWSHHSACERFRCSLRSWGLVNVLYGVTRTEILKQTGLFEHYPGSDFALQADLSIRGRFVQIHGEKLYRRLHDRATSGLDEDDLTAFYQPQSEAPIDSRTLRIFRSHVRVVVDSDASVVEKAQMLGMLVNQAKNWRTTLLRESVTLVRRSFWRAAPRPRS